MKAAVPTDVVVLMTGVGVGLVLGWIFGREWLVRSARDRIAVREQPRNRIRRWLQGCTDVERN